MSEKLPTQDELSEMLKQQPKELLWKQYELHLDLYKHYLEMALKFNIFYYAVTGAVLSFYFSNAADVGMKRYER